MIISPSLLDTNLSQGVVFSAKNTGHQSDKKATKRNP